MSERLPEADSKVLVCDDRENYIAVWEYTGNKLWYGDDIFWLTDDITHWMPLPDPPKMDKPNISENTMNALNKIGEGEKTT